MNHVSWTSILIGLALFLFGIDYLSLSLQELSPTRLKKLLSKCTSSTFKAILIGCFRKVLALLWEPILAQQ